MYLSGTQTSMQTVCARVLITTKDFTTVGNPLLLGETHYKAN